MGSKITRCLVTGGAGFIGGSLAKRLSEQPNFEVVVVDSLLTGSFERLRGIENVRLVKADANDFESMSSIMSSSPCDYVFHYAAVVGVQRTLQNPIAVLKDVNGIRNVLELCKNTGVERVFFASSSEVYGEPVEIPQHEERTPLNARLPYAVVKSLAECYCRAYLHEHNLNYTILRFFNTYGPGQSSDFVVSRFLQQAMSDQDITIYGDGSQTRTYCYIDDNLDFTIKMLQTGQLVNAVVNVGSSEQVSVQELAGEILRLTKSKSKLVHLPALEEGDMTRRQPDNQKMLTILGRPLTSLGDGLSKTFSIESSNRN